MSGTSLDGIDAVLVQFDDERNSVSLVTTYEHSFPGELRSDLQQLIDKPDAATLDRIGHAHRQLGLIYAEAITSLLNKADMSADDISAIGCHGQTVRHQPDTQPAFTMQLGDGATIANTSNIVTVNDFRSADIALGGQGAPLAPAFHEWAFASHAATSMVVNIGGIANVSVLQPETPLTGFDTGPGNTLMDSWCARHRGTSYDSNGDWARSGFCNSKLLQKFLADPYFSRQPPKSTGREYFNLDWLELQLADGNYPAPDVQATLAELTAATIATASITAKVSNIWLCGGGALNGYLVERLTNLMDGTSVQTTAALGIPPEWVEAVAFAWLARARLRGLPTGQPSVTGASSPALLGAVHLPPVT
jgi:anhydro-N-acetylmuramic acid kinase